MKGFAKTLTIRMSPHVGALSSVDTIMFNVVLALLPVCAYAVYSFGIAAILVLVTAVVSCVLTEHLWCRFSGISTTVGDWSAVITGLLYGLILPPSLPLWMVVVGGVVSITLGKCLFGGLGYNPFNPSLVGRAFLQAAFPTAMTTWLIAPAARFRSIPSSSIAIPFTSPQYDGITAATPLSQWKFNQVSTDTSSLFLGTVPGSTGETCALLILLGGVYLASRRMMNWRIPVAILATVAVISGSLHLYDPATFASPLLMLFSGGLVLGAVFMATDMVTSPVTHGGSVIYGVLIGFLTVMIRVWGGVPEGIMYAILIGNAVAPHLDHWIQPRVYGNAVAGAAR